MIPDALRPRFTAGRVLALLAALFASGVGAGFYLRAAVHPDAPPAAPGAPR